jgi:hypothetical protein
MVVTHLLLSLHLHLFVFFGHCVDLRPRVMLSFNMPDVVYKRLLSEESKIRRPVSEVGCGFALWQP